MTVYVGIPRKREMSPIPVSLTRSGYPSFHRRMMYVKDEKANPKSTSEDFSLYQKLFSLRINRHLNQ